MERPELLNDIKNRLQNLYGPRFKGLVLFGSAARGEAGEDSDIDLLCLLDGPVNAVMEIDPIIDATSDLKQKCVKGLFSIKAASLQDYLEGAYPLVIEAKREGAAV